MGLLRWALTFVNDIPGIALSLVMSDNVGNMILHGSNQSRIGPGTAGDYSFVRSHSYMLSYVRTARLTPVGKLAMPDQVMASKLLTILSSQVCNNIAIGESEGILTRLSRIPLESVSNCQSRNRGIS